MKLRDHFTEKKLLAVLLLVCFVFFCLLAYFSETTYDVGDGIRHYLISRYSWAHPGMFLDSWGKPFFTFISSPFSQFGFYGITFFNILCGILSAWITYKIAEKQNYKNAWLCIPFLLFAPIYFPTMNSGLTEPFFGLVLIYSIFLLLDKKHLAAAILVSFLPFVRNEGFFFLPLFFILLVYYRSYIAALFLSFGTVFLSIVGYFYYGDILWIKTQNPYNGANRDEYGTGELSAFADRYYLIWGKALTVLLVLGILCIVFRTFKKQAVDKPKFSAVINVDNVLILGGSVLFFAAHSIMWWKGLANSMGLIRVFAGIMPLTTLICLRGFNLVMPEILFRNRIVKYGIIIILLFFVVRRPFRSEYFPFKPSKEELVVKEAAEWMKQEGHDRKKIYYLYPYLPLLLDIDAFDTKKAADLWGLYPRIKKEGIATIPDGTIIFWDAHFGPNECGIPLDTIMNDPRFDLLKTFYPTERFTTLGGQPFSISIFEKRHSPRTTFKEIAVVPYDPESLDEGLNADSEYGKWMEKPVSALPEKTKKMIFNSVYEGDESASKGAVVVVAIDNVSGQNVFWEGKPFVFSADSTGVKKVSAEFSVPLNAFQAKDIVRIFVWNRDKKVFTIRKKEVRFLGME